MLNKAMLIGFLGKDPEVRFTAAGKSWAKFSLATSERWKDANGEMVEKTTWHNIVVWGKAAEHCGKYLEKGSKVYVEGRIENRSYETDQGEKKYISEVNAFNVRFMDSKRDKEERRSHDRDAGDQRQPSGHDAGGQRHPEDPEPPHASGAYTDDDIPFAWALLLGPLLAALGGGGWI